MNRILSFMALAAVLVGCQATIRHVVTTEESRPPQVREIDRRIGTETNAGSRTPPGHEEVDPIEQLVAAGDVEQQPVDEHASDPAAKLNDVRQRRDRIERDTAELEARRAELIAEVGAAERRLEIVQGHIETLERQHRELDAEVGALREQCERSQLDVHAARDARDRLLVEAKELQAQRNQAHTGLAELISQRDRLDAEVAALHQEREPLERTIAEASAQLAARRKALQDTTGQIAALERQRRALDRANSEVSSEIEKSRTALDSLNEEILRKKQDLADVQRRFAEHTHRPDADNADAATSVLPADGGADTPSWMRWMVVRGTVGVGVFGLATVGLIIIRRRRNLPWIVTATLHEPGGATTEREVLLERDEGIDLEDADGTESKRPIDLINGPKILRDRRGLVLDPCGYDVRLNDDPVTARVGITPGMKISLPNSHRTVVIESAHPAASVPSALGAPCGNLETLQTIGGAA